MPSGLWLYLKMHKVKASVQNGQKPFSFYQRQHLVDVGIDADRLPLDLLRTNCLPLVDTGVGGVRVLRRHLPEGILDDDGGVIANAQFQKENFSACTGAEKILITLRRSVPTFVLNTFIV